MRRLIAALTLVAATTVGVVALDSPADATPRKTTWTACKVVRLPQNPTVVKLWCIRLPIKAWHPIPR